MAFDRRAYHQAYYITHRDRIIEQARRNRRRRRGIRIYREKKRGVVTAFEIMHRMTTEKAERAFSGVLSGDLILSMII